MTPAEDLDETAQLVAAAVEQILELFYKGAPRDFAKPEVVLVLSRDGEVALGCSALGSRMSPAELGFFLGKVAHRLGEGTFVDVVKKGGVH